MKYEFFPSSPLRNASRGFAALFFAILILAVIFLLGVGIVMLTIGEQKISRNIVQSAQAYYTAEAGIEDALLRLAKSLNWSNPYTLQVDDTTSRVAISNIIGGVRTITAEGNAQNRVREVRVIYQISTQKASFYYGAQIGDGGIVMDSGSQVVGNVFSNGSAVGQGTITETIIVARNGNKIDGLTIGENARVHTCKDSTIGGTLTYVSGGSVEDCTASAVVDGGPNEIQPLEFPISDSMIQNWKNDAQAGGVIAGDLTIDTDTSLGPVKIDGNLLVKNATLTITGTIWVTGTFDTGNNVEVRLDEASYGDYSGVLIADGNVQIRNNAVLEGTSFPSSYLLIIGNSPSLDEYDAAIDVKNNALSSILFAPNGLEVIHNNVALLEVTAYQLRLKNNATINYEIGLQDLTFTSGPGGSWEVSSWKEVE